MKLLRQHRKQLAKTLLLALCSTFPSAANLMGQETQPSVAAATPTADPAIPEDKNFGADFPKLIGMVQRNELDAARKLIEEKAKSNPDIHHPDIHIAGMLLQLNRIADGRNLLEKLSGTEPDRFDLRFAFVNIAATEKRWFDAWTHIQHARKSGPPATWTEGHRKEIMGALAKIEGICCENRGDWEDAAKIYTPLAKELLPESPVLMGMARCQFHLGNIEEARKYFKMLHEQEPRAGLPDVSLAQLYDADGKTEEAEKLYRKAIDDPHEGGRNTARLEFARWLIWNNRPVEVGTILKTPFTEPAQEQERKYLASLVFRMQKRYEDAIKILSPMHQAEPTNFAIGNQLALCLIEVADEQSKARAVQIAEANARTHRNNPEAWSTLGWVQLRSGDVQQADRSLSLSLQGGAATRNTIYYVSQLKEKSGDSEGAKEFVEAVKNAKGPLYYDIQ